MEQFELKGDNGYLKISIEKVFGFPNHTSHWGGYETQASVEIKSQHYFVKGYLGITTGQIYEFYKQLEKCQQQVGGMVELNDIESNLSFKISYDELGHVQITGEYREHHYLSTCLTFEISGDQSYLRYALEQLKGITEQYGDNYGIKNRK